MVELFQKWLATEYPRQRKLYCELHDALKAKPWEWSCLEDPEQPNPHPPGSHNAELFARAQARWRALAAAA